MKIFLSELFIFGLKQASACLFGGALLLVMLVTHFWYPVEIIHRYDFIFLFAIFFQFVLLALKLETPKEALVIVVFHFVATIMELFKTSDSIQSWVYPEKYIFGIANVPLFTGFMYSAIGSYIARAWRVFEFRYTCYPRQRYAVILVVLIYVNFFSHHYIYDFRWLLVGLTVGLFYRTTIHFKIIKTHRNMPLLLGWFLVALFIWFAENLATYANIWIYPNQSLEWRMVSIAKLSSWYLLMLLSFVLVALTSKIKIYGIK